MAGLIRAVFGSPPKEFEGLSQILYVGKALPIDFTDVVASSRCLQYPTSQIHGKLVHVHLLHTICKLIVHSSSNNSQSMLKSMPSHSEPELLKSSPKLPSNVLSRSKCKRLTCIFFFKLMAFFISNASVVGIWLSIVQVQNGICMCKLQQFGQQIK